MSATDDPRSFLSRLIRAAGRAVRRPLAFTAAWLAAGWALVESGPPGWAATAALLTAAVAVPRSRRWLWAVASPRQLLTLPRRWLTRRGLLAGLRVMGSRVNLQGEPLPKIRWIRSTPVGERVLIRATAGWTSELLENLSAILRVPLRCRVVRITRDPADGALVTLDIVRRDPFATGVIVRWLDLAASVLSGWDPVHLGRDENGEEVRLSLVERGLLIAGLMGTGKSSLLQLIVAHFAKARELLVLIDPNQVQFGPWKHRAALYATKDPADVLTALQLVQAEIDRRMELFESLPGVIRKLTREVADQLGLRLVLVAIDEMACVTSVIGTGQQQTAIGTAIRDILSRGRAAGVIVVGATQRPTQDVIPKSIAALFLLRMAFKVNAGNSDVILGDGWSKRGYDASEIELEARGVGLLLAEGEKPLRMKAAWIDDDDIAEMSVGTLPGRPADPPGWPTPAGHTAPAPTVERTGAAA